MDNPMMLGLKAAQVDRKSRSPSPQPSLERRGSKISTSPKSGKNKAKICVVGGFVTDLISAVEDIPKKGETLSSSRFSKHPGGKGASAAAAAHRLSHHPNGEPALDLDIEVSIIGAIGEDGSESLKVLKSNGVKCVVEEVPDETTGINMVMVEETPRRENRIIYNRGANNWLEPAHLNGTISESRSKTLRDLITDADLLITQLELQRDTVMEVLKIAKEATRDVEIVFNPSPHVPLRMRVYEGINHLILNQTEALALSSDCKDMNHMHSKDGWDCAAQYFRKKGVENVVITLSAQGAYYANKTGKKYVEPDVKGSPPVIDTTGAGNTFVGAYAVEFLRQKNMDQLFDIEAAVRYACRAAAWTVRDFGSLEPIPWADELETSYD